MKKRLKHRINIYRDTFSNQTTLGKLFIHPEKESEKYFCETLEDAVRPKGIKVKGFTAIPNAVIYKVSTRYSPKFKRYCLVLSNVEDGVTIRSGGIEYKYVMFHGGNSNEDTKGCPLVAFKRINKNTIQSSAENRLYMRINELFDTGDVFALFHNITPYND